MDDLAAELATIVFPHAGNRLQGNGSDLDGQFHGVAVGFRGRPARGELRLRGGCREERRSRRRLARHP